MKTVIFTITVLLGLLFVLVIEVKSKRCHKTPTVVECPDPLTRTCGKNWNITVITKDKFAGATGILNCSAGYSLSGNSSITCLQSGVWSPITAAICVPDDLLRTYVYDFRGSTYTFVFKTKTYIQAKEYCLSMCGTLVEINNKEENQFIYSVIQERFVQRRQFYIGLESRNGINYEWQSKNTTESNGFDDWNKGQPNDIEVDTCVVMFNLKWYDAYKSACRLDDHYFICESRFD